MDIIEPQMLTQGEGFPKSLLGLLWPYIKYSQCGILTSPSCPKLDIGMWSLQEWTSIGGPRTRVTDHT